MVYRLNKLESIMYEEASVIILTVQVFWGRFLKQPTLFSLFPSCLKGSQLRNTESIYLNTPSLKGT